MSRSLIAVFVCALTVGCQGERTSDGTVDVAPRAASESPPSAHGPDDSAPEAPEAEAPGAARTETRGPDLAAIHYRALGTEPFWSVEVTTDSLVLGRLGESDRVFDVKEIRRRPGTDVVVGADDGETIEVSVRRETCSDGMSDSVYAFSSRVTLKDEELRGCAIDRPIVVREAEVDPVAEAGLGQAVAAARAIRDRQASFDRVVGSLDRDGVDATYAAHFEGGAVRLIEFRLRDGDEVREETSFYFFADPVPGTTALLVDGEAWTGDSMDYTWFLMGYGRDGSPTGQRVERGQGVGVEPPAGMAEDKRALAAELEEAARGRRS